MTHQTLEEALTEYDELVRQSYVLAGHHTGHGLGTIAPLQERQTHAAKVRGLRDRILQAQVAVPEEETSVQGEEGSDRYFLRELARLIFHNVAPTTGIDQYHCERLEQIAKKVSGKAEAE